MNRIRFVILAAGLSLAGCAPATDGAPSAALTVGAKVDAGIASHYGHREPQGIACGRGRLNAAGMTAAHKTLPCWSRVRVVSKSNGRHVDVVINDRGPYVRGRVIDLTHGAALALGFAHKGLDRVDVYRID